MIRTSTGVDGQQVGTGGGEIQLMHIAMVESWDTLNGSANGVMIMTVLWRSRGIMGSKCSTR